MMRSLRFAGFALVAAILGAAAVVVAFARDDGPSPTTRATIAIHYSKFSQGGITVPARVPVTFTLANQDPIGHEWIIGDEAVHARHRTGTEPYHDEIPTEISLRAYETKTTTIVFDKAGDYVYICHLPGHEEYGMKGVVHVVGD